MDKFSHATLSACCYQHGNQLIVVLSIFSLCTVCLMYYNVSVKPGHFLNRHVYIENPHRWNDLLNGTDDQVWPKRFNETDDRIQTQLRFMKYYGSIPANRTMKHILRVGTFNFEAVHAGQFHFVDCPVKECSLTFSETVTHEADVLLITEMGVFNWQRYLPKPPHQLWIAQHWESAKHDRIDAWLVRRYINWSDSYRRDSTVAISYGKYARTMEADSSVQTIDYSAGKTRHVAWLVSNCNAMNNRLEYAHKLAKYIDVDVYGRCGWLTCNRTGPESCHNLLKKKYRFFLAFENSNCKDYITEKLYHAALKYVYS